jgi:tetratricopeptide (TPR) repeat protein
MPGKIKALWFFCIVVIVAGFLVLGYQGAMSNAREQAELASRSAAEKQKELAKKIIKIDPIKKIRELNALGKYQEAVDMAKQVAQKFPDHAKIQTWLGISLVKTGEREEAIKHFILAAKNDPTDEKAHLYWGLTLAMDGKIEDAIAHYKTVLEINPEHSSAYTYWGASLNTLNKLDEAIAKLEESLSLNKFNGQAYDVLIDVLYKQQKYENAWKRVHEARSSKVSLQQSSIDRLSKVFPEPAQKL